MIICYILAGIFALAARINAQKHAGLHVISKDWENATSVPGNTDLAELMRRANDPADFGWIKRWSAIGDSFTAGIGSGRVLRGPTNGRSHYKCSRYDLSYPMLVDQALGPGVNRFDFVAYSGDRTGGIYDQALYLEPEQDLVMMTAGGNDFCLAAMIKKCVFLPYDGENKCQEVINKARENIESILRPNLKSILEILNNKMAKDSVVVFSGYAPFFNTENEDCATKQNWKLEQLTWWKIWPFYPRPFDLTVKYRKQFNELVTSINRVIEDVISDVTKNSKVKYKIGYSDWSKWADLPQVRGQYCDPRSTGAYPDDAQPNLMFFKPHTRKPDRQGHDPDQLKKRWEGMTEEEIQAVEAEVQKRREEEEAKENIYETLLWKSANPKAVAVKKLNPRAPSPPNCPGDDGWIDPTLGLGLPDSFGKNFHPNRFGHLVMASFAIETMIQQRAKVLGVDNPSCTVQDNFKCWQKEGRKGYASADLLDENYKDFCNNYVKKPENEVGWKAEKTYNEGTPEEHTLVLDLKDATEYDKDACLDSFKRIIHGCDGNDDKNPMNWKFGGKYVRGAYTYELNIKRDNRPWPPPKEPYGTCGSVNNWILFWPTWSSFVIHGAGWGGHDWGQQTLLDNAKKCLGLGVTMWRFDYFDKPDENGMEWKAEFNTPILVKGRCFDNEKVVKWGGGRTRSINKGEDKGCGFF